ncbi:unnamed protein product [Rotaria socialis]|uniref:Uncharacterized protein n=1 Tax=Rotaria socialis TaxID=392032 RepID=A0A817TKX5_9BILA|nr:unnamed protein product [Rotaria socialis]CAF4322308.1 unnamed protein product [Rotaria socialis]
MLYMPATTLATPLVLQETKTVPFLPQYYMVPTTTTTTTTMIPTASFLNTTFAYPTYGILTKTIEKPPTVEVKQPPQQIIHHYPSSCSTNHYSDCCDLCCPWKDQSPNSSNQRSRSRSQSQSRSRSRSHSPPTCDQERYSRCDQYDGSKCNPNVETVDEKIARIRRELHLNSASRHDKSTETIDYYHRRPSPPPPITLEQRIPYKQHYDAPKPRRRSTSSNRASSLPREPWRSSNQNDYAWRDAHMPAYRAATLNRSQTSLNESHQSHETAHQRSHLNAEHRSTTNCNNNYVYRPKSEVETRKYYIQTTGKNPDHEVCQALHPKTATYYSTGSCYDTQSHTKTHSFYSEVPKTTYAPKLVDLTPSHNSYTSNDQCIHIVPKNGSTLDPPYLKIYNAPVTYLH